MLNIKVVSAMPTRNIIAKAYTIDHEFFVSYKTSKTIKFGESTSSLARLLQVLRSTKPKCMVIWLNKKKCPKSIESPISMSLFDSTMTHHFLDISLLISTKWYCVIFILFFFFLYCCILAKI